MFQANVDANSIVKVVFNSSVLGKYIRIHPTNCSIRCALRMELYGCNSKEGIVIIFYIGIFSWQRKEILRTFVKSYKASIESECMACIIIDLVIENLLYGTTYR